MIILFFTRGKLFLPESRKSLNRIVTLPPWKKDLSVVLLCKFSKKAAKRRGGRTSSSGSLFTLLGWGNK